MKEDKKWLIFILVAIAQFMVVLDSSITNVALPSIQKSLHFNTSTLQWVITAYALTFGGFLLLGGRASDLFGRRRILLIGMSGFTLISFFIGVSHSAVLLIILRSLQGLTGALMSPAALSIVLTTFKEGEDRNKALGFWTTVATGGAAFGLLLGGILTQYFGWRWNFFINVPVGLIIIPLILRIVPLHEREEGIHSSLDLPGAALITSGLITLVYVISEAPLWGWGSMSTVGLLGLAIVLLTLFVLNESRSTHPLIPLSIFKIRNVTGANIMMAPILAGMYGMFFLTSLYIQTVMHYSPIQSGLSFLPFPVILGIVSTRMGPLVSKFGFKRFLLIGPVLIACGMGWMVRLPLNGHYFMDVLPALIIMPIGIGMTIMPLIVAATSGVQLNKSGLVSGLINTSQQMGGALGLAILSGVASSATVSATNLSGLAAIVHGYNQAFLVGVIFIIIATIFGSLIISEKRRSSKDSSVSDMEPVIVH